jgi:hypothetical protein
MVMEHVLSWTVALATCAKCQIARLLSMKQNIHGDGSDLQPGRNIWTGRNMRSKLELTQSNRNVWSAYPQAKHLLRHFIMFWKKQCKNYSIIMYIQISQLQLHVYSRLYRNNLYFYFWGLHPVASIANDFLGFCQSQLIFFFMYYILFLLHTHYI